MQSAAAARRSARFPRGTYDAAETRAQTAQVEKLKAQLPDRGAVFYFLATAHRHLGDTLEAFSDLQHSVDMGEGFDPSGDVEFSGLEGTHDFDSLVQKVHEEFPAVSRSHPAIWDDERDLIPDGLSWDPRGNAFYLSSLNLRKIVRLAPDSHATDFIPPGRDHLLPIRGMRVAAQDGTLWAASSNEEGRSELLHFSSSGLLLGRYAPKESGLLGMNDLVVAAGNEILVTNTIAGDVVRFDPAKKTFAKLGLYRPLFSPKGIALDERHQVLFVGDALGVVRVDLKDGSSEDVDPGHRNTLAGASSLSWHEGSLVAIQTGIGSPRVAAFRLSEDGTHVKHTTILEYRTPLVASPAKGALRGSDFYYVTNSHEDNLLNGKIRDMTQLEQVRIAAVSVP